MARRRTILAVAAAATLFAAGCGPDIDLTKALEFRVLNSGYFDDGIHDGQTRLLPQLEFEIHNRSDRPISSVILLLSYYQSDADGEYDSATQDGIGATAIAPGESTKPAIVRAPHGYTFPGARADFFTNSLFRDIVVKVFAKKRGGYMPLGSFKVERRILEPTGRTPGTQ